MSCLLAARANSDLQRYAMGTSLPRAQALKQAAGAEVVQISKSFGKDPEAWLVANCPALVGPHAGRHWVKHCLKGLGTQRWSLT